MGFTTGITILEKRTSVFFRSILPTYDGSPFVVDLWEWVDALDDYFEGMQPPDELKCKISPYTLVEEADSWWQQLQRERIHIGKAKVSSWPRMKRLLGRRFSSANCLMKVQSSVFDYKLGTECMRSYRDELYYTTKIKGIAAKTTGETHGKQIENRKEERVKQEFTPTNCLTEVPIESHISKQGPIQVDLSEHKFEVDHPLKEKLQLKSFEEWSTPALKRTTSKHIESAEKCDEENLLQREIELMPDTKEDDLNEFGFLGVTPANNVGMLLNLSQTKPMNEGTTRHPQPENKLRGIELLDSVDGLKNGRGAAKGICDVQIREMQEGIYQQLIGATWMLYMCQVIILNLASQCIILLDKALSFMFDLGGKWQQELNASVGQGQSGVVIIIEQHQWDMLDTKMERFSLKLIFKQNYWSCVAIPMSRFVATGVDAYLTPFLKRYLYEFLSKFDGDPVSYYPLIEIIRNFGNYPSLSFNILLDCIILRFDVATEIVPFKSSSLVKANGFCNGDWHPHIMLKDEISMRIVFCSYLWLGNRRYSLVCFKMVILVKLCGRISGRILTDYSFGYQVNVGVSWLYDVFNENYLAPLLCCLGPPLHWTSEGNLLLYDQDLESSALFSIDGHQAPQQIVIESWRGEHANSIYVLLQNVLVVLDWHPELRHVGLERVVLQWCLYRMKGWFTSLTDLISLRSWDPDKVVIGGKVTDFVRQVGRILIKVGHTISKQMSLSLVIGFQENIRLIRNMLGDSDLDNEFIAERSFGFWESNIVPNQAGVFLYLGKQIALELQNGKSSNCLDSYLNQDPRATTIHTIIQSKCIEDDLKDPYSVAIRSMQYLVPTSDLHFLIVVTIVNRRSWVRYSLSSHVAAPTFTMEGIVVEGECYILIFNGHWGYNANLTRGRVIPWEGWNDENNANTEGKFIMTKLSVVTLFTCLNILCDNGKLTKTLKVFYKMINGLDPPKYSMLSLGSFNVLDSSSSMDALVVVLF